jgi:hypothetical protein
MINPAKLKSLVDLQSMAPNAAALGVSVPAPEAEDDLEDDEEEEASSTDPVARGNELLAEWGAFGDVLLESAAAFHDNAHEVGAELLLKEVPADAIDDVAKSVDRMPEDVQQGLAKYVSPASDQDCEAVTAVLVSKLDEDQPDAALICAYLRQASKYAGEEFEILEDEEEDEEDAEEGEAVPPGAEGAEGAES